MSERGRFIVLEGGDASGKTTQRTRLVARLVGAGHQVVETFEPGATAVGQLIRAVLLDGDEPLPSEAEALLMAADRAAHVAEVVRPALERGAWVVSDRYVPSSLVYQGMVRGVGVGEVERTSRWATRDLDPDLVVVLDVDEETARARRPDVADRMEREDAGFHAAVREAYRKLAPERGWSVVDATGGPAEVADRIWVTVREALEP